MIGLIGKMTLEKKIMDVTELIMQLSERREFYGEETVQAEVLRQQYE